MGNEALKGFKQDSIVIRLVLCFFFQIDVLMASAEMDFGVFEGEICSYTLLQYLREMGQLKAVSVERRGPI